MSVAAVHGLTPEVISETVRQSLEEDLGTGGDCTTVSLVPEDRMASAKLLAREACVVAGVPVAEEVFRQVNDSLQVTVIAQDGSAVDAGADILEISGPAGAILTAERTALNFMQRMCGVATMAQRFVDATAAHGTLILDTRKTTPTLRAFEKYAVTCGGGTNHRFGLYDRVLIKDNHRKLWGGGDEALSLRAAVETARDRFPKLEIEIEVETLDELADALEGSPEWVLLDNMGPELLAKAVALAAGRTKTEASGGITMANVAAVAASGVDAISLGCLTHSAPSVDLSLEIDL
ncbi:MAG: carboxylating nicotinate-nucleotide diphosphorylase [Kiritimatiellae bacterium]|nr:carboxylating nicotinate-nucleotide diphosphorylase [Kiritimatiellia bacterium]